MRTVESTRRFTRTWCKSHDVKVREDVNVKVPHARFNPETGHKEIYLPPLSSLNFNEWRRIAYHEAAHLDPENLWHYFILHRLNQVAKSPQHGEFLRSISNLVIDNLAERTKFNIFRGRAELMASARSEIIPKLGDNMRKEQAPPAHHLLMGLLRWDMLNREEWMTGFTAPLAHEPLPHLEWYDQEIAKLDITRRVDELQANADVDTAAQLMVDISNILPQEEQQGEGQGGSSEDNNQTPDNETAGDSESGEAGDSDPEEGSGTSDEVPDSDGAESSEGDSGEAGGAEDNSEGSEGGQSDGESNSEQSGGDSSGEDSSESSAEELGKDGANTQDSDSGDAKEGNIYSLGLDADDDSLGEYNKDIHREVEKQDWSEVRYNYHRSGEQYYVPLEQQKYIKVKDDESNVKPFRKKKIEELFGRSNLDRQVRKHLQLKSMGRTVHGVKRGRLSNKSLHRLYNGNAKVQPKVFKKEEHGAVKTDSAVTLLIDCSGSMGSSEDSTKYGTAAASVVSFAEVLKGLRIEHEILGFTHRGYANWVYYFKEYGEKLSRNSLINKLSSSQVRQGYNADGEALQHAAERLLTRKERNKVLVVLSDGMPAGNFDGDGAYYLQQVVDDIQDNSPIHLASIGIESDCVEEFYKNCRVIYQIEQLSAAVLETLRTNLLT